MPMVLVTGAAGFIGSHLSNYLSSQGLKVRATDLPGTDPSVLNKKIKFIPADLCNPKSLEPVVKGVDMIFHVAAIFDFSAKENLLNRVNVQGTENLCRLALRHGVKKIINFSSFGVYGDFGDQTPGAIDEKTPKRPSNPYGRSKFKQDKVIYKFGKKGLKWVIVRPSVPYGPRNFYGAFQIFKIISLLPVVPVPKNMKMRASYIHIDDVVGAVWHLASRKGSVGKEFNLTDCSNYSLSEFLDILAKIFHKPRVPVFLPKFLLPNLIRATALLDFVIIHLFKKRPFVSKDALAYSLMDLPFSNKKILNSGYRFKYPDPARGFRKVLQWYQKEAIL